MKITCAVTPLLSAAALAAPLEARDHAQFPTYAVGDWTVTDKGERCHADFSVDGDTVLGFMGPYYHSPGEPASGSIIDLANESGYKLPKGDRHGEFPAELVAGAARYAVSGFATDIGGSLVVDSGSMPTVADLLAALPDTVTLSAVVKGKQVYSIALTGNRGAARALQDCTAFITAQMRPGTKNGPELGPPGPPQLEIFGEQTLERPPTEPLVGALPEAGPPKALPRLR